MQSVTITNKFANDSKQIKPKVEKVEQAKIKKEEASLDSGLGSTTMVVRMRTMTNLLTASTQESTILFSP